MDKERKGERMTEFKPCPMCGEELSMEDVCFYDEEGCQYDHVSNVLVEQVGIFCNCGYSYATEIENLYDEEEDLCEGGKWEKNFITLANRRYKEE